MHQSVLLWQRDGVQAYVTGRQVRVGAAIAREEMGHAQLSISTMSRTCVERAPVGYHIVHRESENTGGMVLQFHNKHASPCYHLRGPLTPQTGGRTFLEVIEDFCRRQTVESSPPRAARGVP